MAKNPGLRHRNDAVAAAIAVRSDAAPTAPAEKPRPISLTVRLPPDLHEKLRRIAFDERTSIHALLLEGLDATLKRHGGAAPQ